MKTRVSVIIPVYNVQEFLEECVDSVLSQSILNLELTDGYQRNLQIILVDDGSTDDSALIAKNYANEYDFVEYIYEENQGLGHARNYGCEFAQGDYIIFLDSDDLIPPKAYERMYKAAIKNNSDLTIGSVWRIKSSTNAIASNIHEIAFSGTEEVTHITKSPQLFYDTTAWNKLIKKTFWDKYEFKFPEGILYEDIPVTMPMHYLANNVSIIYENCYLWRIREGISKSITQTTDETKTLEDRLFVMGKVDEFFKNNVSEENLIQTKDIKWLKIDLMIFINKLRNMTLSESQNHIKILQEYIKNNIDLKLLEELNEFDELKYEYLLNNDFEKLVELLNFEYMDLKSQKIYSKNSHIYVDGNPNILKTPNFCIDKYIKEYKRKAKYLTDVRFRNDCIQVKGFAIVPGLKDEDFSDRDFSFQLVNSETHEKIPLPYDNIKIDDFAPYNIPFGNSFSYKAAGYQVYVPYELVKDNDDFLGENKILVSFKQDEIVYNYFAGVAKIEARRSSDLKAKLVDDTYFFLKYDLKNKLTIDISNVKNSPSEVYCENDMLYLNSMKLGNIYLHYEKDSINEEKKILLDYDENNQRYYIDVDEISEYEGHLVYENGEPVIKKSKEFISLESNKGQIAINSLRDYNYKIHKCNNITLVSYIDRIHAVFEFDTQLFSVDSKGKTLKSATLYFKDNKNFEKYYVAKGEYDESENIIRYKVNMKNKKIKENLYQGFHDLYIEYDFGDIVFSTQLYLLKQFARTYQEKLYHYKLYRSNKSTLRMQVTRVWGERENTYMKRVKNLKFYRLFKYLPIKKNRVLFESMWGSKYSCNPRYFYEYIDENKNEYECIWSLTDEHTPIKGNGKRVRRDSIKYYYYLATSKYFINNVNFPDYYTKRDGQIEIQTMHGTPLKTLGLDVPGDFNSKEAENNYIKKCNRWDYLTVQSDFVSDISKRCFLFKKKLLKLGYPRTDILYSKNNEDDIARLKKKIGLPLDKKVILYAPTWRIKNKFELKLDIESFRKSLSDEYVLILRLHHFSERGWVQPPDDEFIYDLSKYDSIEELYLISDILITDYSSVMFDYSILNRPIILFTYDMDEYKDKLRGMYIDINESKPGPILYTSKEVENAIINIDKIEEEYYEYRQKFIERFNQYEQENTSELIFNEVFKGK